MGRQLPEYIAERQDMATGMTSTSSGKNRGDMQKRKTLPPRADVPAGVTAILGWVEFSILLQAIFYAMPKNLFRSPLQMCLKLLQRGSERHGGPQRARDVDKTSSSTSHGSGQAARHTVGKIGGNPKA